MNVIERDVPQCYHLQKFKIYLCLQTSRFMNMSWRLEAWNKISRKSIVDAESMLHVTKIPSHSKVVISKFLKFVLKSSQIQPGLLVLLLAYSRLYYNYLVNSIIVSAFTVLLSKFRLNYPEAYLLKSIAIEVSLSPAILFQISIAIAIGDTCFGCIAIDYRDTFRQYR